MVEKYELQTNWLLFFLFLLFIQGKNRKKLNFQEINLVELDKKTKLLSRIKGYMEAEEQEVLNNAGIILEIIGKVKKLMDRPQREESEISYPLLSLEDRKRNMLMDISEFFQDEQKVLVQQAVDFDIKIKNLEQKLNELNKLLQEGRHMDNIHNYIEIFEPILTDEAREKAFEIKKLAAIIKAISSLRSKDRIEELDIIKIIEPFISEEQKDSLTRIIQIIKVVKSAGEEDTGEEDQIPAVHKEDNPG